MRKLLYDPQMMPKGLIALVILFILVITLAFAVVGAFGRLAAVHNDLAATSAKLYQYELSYAAMDVALAERDKGIEVLRGDFNSAVQQLWDAGLVWQEE